MRMGFSWTVGLLLVVAGCGGDDDAAKQGTGTTPIVAPPAPVVTNPGATGGSAANPGSVGMTPGGTGVPPTTPVGTVPAAGTGAMPMAGSAAMPMAGGMGGRGGRGGSGAMAGTGMAGTGMAGTGMAGTGMAGTGMAGSGTAGMTPPDGCVENLTCQLAALPSTGDVHQDCVDRINQFRTQCACLTAYTRWTEGEACADMMAEYDSTQPTAHAGFRVPICPGGSSQNECPGWRSESMIVSGCLQSMWNEGPPPTPMCSDACFQEYGHFINMTSTRSTKVACGFFKTPEGEIWSVQNFSR